jgi:hypothetical protein
VNGISSRIFQRFFVEVNMPYKIQPLGSKFQVINSETKKVMGEHASLAKAKAQMAALYANEPEASKRSKMDKFKVAEIHKHAEHIMSHTSSMMEEPETPEEAEAETPEDEAAGKGLNLSYCKSLGVHIPDMAVKYVALDTIKGYTFLWGNEKLTDVEFEYFTPTTNFWDDKLGKSARPLTWDHAQDPDFKASPVIGSVTNFGDDEVGRWYEAKLDRAHRYRKAIDALIEAGKLGTSSDSAPQYVQRKKTGKSTQLIEWPWFASALTDCPAEPRMIGSLEVLKSLGILLPDTSVSTAWDWNRQRLQLLKIK